MDKQGRKSGTTTKRIPAGELLNTAILLKDCGFRSKELFARGLRQGAGQISADHLSPKGKHPIAQGREATLGIYEQIDATPTGLHRPAQPPMAFSCRSR